MVSTSISEPGEIPNPGKPQAAPAAFRNPKGITRALKIALWASLVIDATAIGSGLLELQLLRDFQTGAIAPSAIDAAAEASDLRQRIVGITQITVIVATIIVFARWIYVVNANKRSLGATGLEFTPGWAVGWFFVPIANLWKPYQAMKEVWQVSADPFMWRLQYRGAILPWWWFLWLADNILGQASFRFSLAAKTMTDVIAASMAATVANGVSVAATVVAMSLVGRIARMQLARKQTWDTLVEADDRIKTIIEKLRPLGQKWVDKFLSSYLSMKDRDRLPDLVNGIIADARTEAEGRAKTAGDTERRVPCDLPPLDGRAGPFDYRGRDYYSYPDGRVDGYTRAAGWWRFQSLAEFQAQVGDELDKVR
jgi:hypothetical protein